MSIHSVVAIAIAILLIVALYGLASGGLSEIEEAITGDDGSIQDDAQQPEGKEWESPDEINEDFRDNAELIQSG
ncbi:MAG: hypothetical protein H8Z69_03015 [Nanohaloarchaea archaeon]|nr:hypothetical protein [Candidatus Nanohaloarchaea archaeon]